MNMYLRTSSFCNSSVPEKVVGQKVNISNNFNGTRFQKLPFWVAAGALPTLGLTHLGYIDGCF